MQHEKFPDFFASFMKFNSSKLATLSCNFSRCGTEHTGWSFLEVGRSCYHVFCKSHVISADRCPVCGIRTYIEKLEIENSIRSQPERNSLERFIDLVDTIAICDVQASSAIPRVNQPRSNICRQTR